MERPVLEELDSFENGYIAVFLISCFSTCAFGNQYNHEQKSTVIFHEKEI